MYIYVYVYMGRYSSGDHGHGAHRRFQELCRSCSDCTQVLGTIDSRTVQGMVSQYAENLKSGPCYLFLNSGLCVAL